jgi:hypothetical protein
LERRLLLMVSLKRRSAELQELPQRLLEALRLTLLKQQGLLLVQQR